MTWASSGHAIWEQVFYLKKD